MSKLGKWGGAALIATGAAVLGIGLGGEEVAAAFPDSGVAAGLGEAGAAINTAGANALNAVNLDGAAYGKAAMAIAGGTAAVAGAGLMISSSDKDDDSESKKTIAGIEQQMDERQREEIEQARLQFIRAMKEKGEIPGGTPPAPPSTDKGRGQ